MERPNNDDEYLFHDFSTGGADEPLPDIFQAIFSQPENQTSSYDFIDYDDEPYVGNNDFEDINPYVHDDEEYFDEDEYADEDESFYEDESPYEEPLTAESDAEYDAYNDSGEYRTYDGNHEYRSFDATLPEASPEGWYHYSDEDLELERFSEELAAPSPKAHRKLKIFANAMLSLLTVLSLIYLLVIYSNIGILTELRDKYIRTAMETMNHKWAATAIIPGDIIDEVMLAKYQSDRGNVGRESDWGGVPEVPPLPSFETKEPEPEVVSTEDTESIEEESVVSDEDTFFTIFHELDRDSMQDYIDEHPDVLENGWANIDINESGLEDDGTDILTIHGDQVLAVNAKDGVLLIRVEFSGVINYARGILAICKDTSRLSLCPAETLGIIGQTVGNICDANNGVLAITGSAFVDPEGNGNGGTLSGLMVSDGVTYGTPLGDSYKRLELRNDNKMYVVDSYTEVDADTRDASEFMPAVIVDGEIIVGTGWDAPQPRAVLGQSSKLETMIVIAEGRLADSIGCGVEEIAEVMKEYGCVQAMNLDGGTSAIMYYKGEYVTRCSNSFLPGGRTLPSAWVYHSAD